MIQSIEDTVLKNNSDFVVQNALLPTEDSSNSDDDLEPASPPRVDLSWEDPVPVAFEPPSPAFSCDDETDQDSCSTASDCSPPRMDLSRYFWEDDHSESNYDIPSQSGEYVEPESGIPLLSQSGEYVEPESEIKESVSDNYSNSNLPQDSNDASSLGNPESNKGQYSSYYSEKRKRKIKSVEIQIKKSK